MQPETEGLEEQGPSGVPYINDPEKPTSPPLNDADATDEDEDEAEEDIQDEAESI
ncbi:hypothetical protein C4C32_14260 [Pseudomonas corrugata]|uniref:Uncharacterized protein n=1 Tax=Pseudomonas corrugata TaxID=47879 RepID=A0A8B6UIQ3_9PSED|nr:hypothetical protein [Pseudomonas corrugata]MDU9037757.1 hypothetical protein [Pseudomonas corrugata]MDU9038948.1 hypothetical protein [Pseudomonas corrugata]QTH11780.1 hypothetical protein C4C32_14260 [Pseudomonas corrugata]